MEAIDGGGIVVKDEAVHPIGEAMPAAEGMPVDAAGAPAGEFDAAAIAAAAAAAAAAGAVPGQETDVASMLLGLSADGTIPEGMDPEAAAALQLQIQQQQQLQIQLLLAQAQAAVGAPGGEPQVLSLLPIGADGTAAGADSADAAGNQAALLAQLGVLQVPGIVGLGGAQLLAAPADGEAAADGSDEPAAKRARLGDGADGDAAADGDAEAMQITALTPEQQAQLQAMLAQDPTLAGTLAAGAGALNADGSAALLEGLGAQGAQALTLGDAGADEQLQQLMAIQAQILQQGIESGELVPGPDGMLSAEQLQHLQLQTQLAQLQQVQMQQLLLQQLQMQQGEGIVIGADGTAVALAPPEGQASNPSRGGGGRGAGEPAVVRRHGAAPERTITRDSLRELFHLPIEDAAKALNIGQTMLKHYCRKFGIPRWPFRKRQSITILINSIEDFSRNRPVNVGPALAKLKSFLDLIDEDPNVDLDGPIKRLRQAFFKEAYKTRQRDKKGDTGDRSTRAQRNQQRTDQWLEQLCHAVVHEQAGDVAPAGINYGEIEAAAAAAAAAEAGMVGDDATAAAVAAMANAQMIEALQASGAALAMNPDGTLVFTPEQLEALQAMQLQGLTGQGGELTLEQLQAQAAEGGALGAAGQLIGADGQPIHIPTNPDGTVDEAQLQQLLLMQQQLLLSQQLHQHLGAAAEGEAGADGVHVDGDAAAAVAAAAAAAAGLDPAALAALMAQQQVAAGADGEHGAFDAAAMEAMASVAAAHAPPSDDHGVGLDAAAAAAAAAVAAAAAGDGDGAMPLEAA